MRSLCFASVLALGSVLAACSAPAEANPAVRCAADGACPASTVCHAGFCLGQDEAEPVAPGTDVDRGAEGIATPPDGGSADDETSADDGHDNSGPGSADQGESGDDEEQDNDESDPSCARCCTPGVNICVDVCVDLLSTVDHCGQCGRICNAGEVCVHGECCAEGEVVCDGRCVDPKRDKDHCGGCGQACDQGPCKEGTCRRDP